MAQAALTQILDSINILDAEELRAVELAAQERLRQQTSGYSPGEWGALQSLMQAGLLTEIKPKKQADSYAERPLVTIQGKSLSETIIEERRCSTPMSYQQLRPSLLQCSNMQRP